MGDIASVATAIATIFLVIVTWKYARTTKGMAEEAVRAGNAAEQSAAASRDAAEATLASLPVKFTVRPMVAAGGKPGSWLGIELLCTGAAVFVHSVRLLEYSELYDITNGLVTRHSPFTANYLLPLNLEPADKDFPERLGHPEVPRSVPELPLRMFSGEVSFFQIPLSVELSGEKVQSIVAEVDFSVWEAGRLHQRTVRGRAMDAHLEEWDWPIETH